MNCIVCRRLFNLSADGLISLKEPFGGDTPNLVRVFFKNYNLLKKIIYNSIYIMSGTGSLMIRNLRKPSDYSKAVMNQDQLLKVAIANDANIARARKGVLLGEIVPLTEIQQFTPEELQADTGKQESDALNNLLRIFPYRRASEIVADLTIDEIFALNNIFPQLEPDFKKKFDPATTTKTFFLEYLRKFLEIVAETKGVSENTNLFNNKFGQLVNDINDMKAILPTKSQLVVLTSIVNQLRRQLPAEIINPISERLSALEGSMLTEADYRRISGESEVSQFEKIAELQRITENLPTRDRFEEVIRLINSRQANTDDDFYDAVDRIEELVDGIDARMIEGLDEIGRAGEATSQTQEVINYISPDSVYDYTNKVLKAYVVKLITRNPALKRGVPVSSLKTKFDIQYWLEERDDEIRATIPQAFAMEAVVAQPVSDGGEKEGKGIGRSISVKKTPVKKSIGKGIELAERPQYLTLGKYVINYGQLADKDILNVKYPSLGRIPALPPVAISDAFKDFLIDLLETGKINKRAYEFIPVEERKLFERITTGAGLIHKLGIKKTITDSDKDEADRFDLLRGEYLAGNNAQSVIRELRRFVVKFMAEGKIRKNEGMNLLMELS